MKYLKTFESFSPINEEGVFDTISNAVQKTKKSLFGDVIEDQLKTITVLSKKNESEVRKAIEQIKSEKDISTKNELLKELIGDWDDKNIQSKLSRIGVKVNSLRDKLGCMTPEEKESYDSRPGGSTGWEGSRGFH
jgi:sulfatase maturation enzyme AslB (radical SAM superfamily)